MLVDLGSSSSFKIQEKGHLKTKTPKLKGKTKIFGSSIANDSANFVEENSRNGGSPHNII